MRQVNIKPVHLTVAVGAVVLAYVWLRGVKGAAQDAGQAATGAIGGLVEGFGLGLGIPTTDADKCKAAKESGDLWGQSLYCTAGDFVTDGLGGMFGRTVTGIGEAIGIPATDQSACEAAKARGDTLGASFACPAGDFLRWTWDRVTK